MQNDPRDNLPPETRQRIEAAMQQFGGNMPQNVFVRQSPNATFGNVPQQTEGTPGPFGNVPGSFGGVTPEEVQRIFGGGAVPNPQQASAGGTFQHGQQILRAQFTNAAKHHAGHAQAWAHWEYDPYEWALFDTVDWESVRNKALQKFIGGPIVCVALIVVVLAVIWVLSHSSTVLLVIGTMAAIILLTILMLLMVSAGKSVNDAKKRYQARQNQAEPHRVTFSGGGVWEAGTYFALKEPFMELKSVTLTAHPPVLHFKMLKADLKGDLSDRQANAPTIKRLHVLVPRGHEGEAEQLLQRYYAEVINTKGRYTPREPV